MAKRMAVFAFLLATASAAWAQSPAGSEFQVNAYTFGTQYRSAVASDADGSFVVVWLSAFNPGGGGIFG